MLQQKIRAVCATPKSHPGPHTSIPVAGHSLQADRRREGVLGVWGDESLEPATLLEGDTILRRVFGGSSEEPALSHF